MTREEAIAHLNLGKNASPATEDSTSNNHSGTSDVTPATSTADVVSDSNTKIEDHPVTSEKIVDDKSTDNDDDKSASSDENNNGNSDGNTDGNSKDRKKQKFSKQEKISHSFAKEKAKRREAQMRLEAKEKEIKELEERLKKYEGLKKEHFDDEDAYLDFKMDRRLDTEKVANLKSEIQSEQNVLSSEEAAEIANDRLEKNFTNEDERSKYQNLVYKAESDYGSIHPELGVNKFSDLLTSEKDHTVLEYLQDSDNSPKLLRHFILKPEALIRIMSMHNPYNKTLELKQLENRMMQFERMHSHDSSKNKLPDTGKQINNTSTSDTSIHNKDYWIKHLKSRGQLKN